jgi:hypothetical protein
VSSVTVNAAGSGYSSSAFITFVGGSGAISQASGALNLNAGGSITSVTVLSGGAYGSVSPAPTITISDSAVAAAGTVGLMPFAINEATRFISPTKVLEYMAMGRPIVSFDLREARVSAGDAAVYLPDNDEYAFAGAIDALLRDPQRRAEMGQYGRSRIAGDLSWAVSRENLIRFYKQLLPD